MTNNFEISNLVRQIEELPTLPSVVQKINDLLQNPKTSAEEVGSTIKMDQTITSKVIRLVNSAFYGFPGRINTITHAIVILGFSTVRNIVLTASIIGAFKGEKRLGRFDLNAFWEHSICTGVLAQHMAKRLKLANTEEIFICGLIHDIGKLIQFLYLPHDFSKIMEIIETDDCLYYQAEKHSLLASHSEIGYWLCNHWGLPDFMQDAAKNHHNPEEGDDTMLNYIIHTADILAKGLSYGNSGDDQIPPIDKNAWKTLKLNKFEIAEILRSSKTSMEKASIFLKLI